jgi:hypothetical protein
MAREIAKATVAALPALFDELGITKVKRDDRFSLDYSEGLLEVRVKRKSGLTETAMVRVSGSGFHQMSSFDPDQMDKPDRNKLICTLYKNGRGETQEVLGRKFGLSQAMINRIVNS